MEKDPPWRPEFRGNHSVYLTGMGLELCDAYGTDKLLAKAKSDWMIRLLRRTHKIEAGEIGVQKTAACAISK